MNPQRGLLSTVPRYSPAHILDAVDGHNGDFPRRQPGHLDGLEGSQTVLIAVGKDSVYGLAPVGGFDKGVFHCFLGCYTVKLPYSTSMISMLGYCIRA